MAGRTWFITGASRGLGRAIAEAALACGDRVAGASRRPEQMDSLLERYGSRVFVPIALDVTGAPAVEHAVASVVERFGRLDVAVNSAGAVHVGALEELTEAEARAQIELLLFGPFFVTRAAVRHMRATGGTLIYLSSLAAIGGLPGHSFYAAGKWALEGMTEASRLELAEFGIRSILIEPGGFRTSIAESVTMSAPNPAYEAPLRPQRERYLNGSFAAADGDPRRAAEAILALVDLEQPPKRLLLGTQAFERATTIWRERLEEAAAWESTSRSMYFTSDSPAPDSAA